MRDTCSEFVPAFTGRIVTETDSLREYDLKKGDIVECRPDDHLGIGYDIRWGNPSMPTGYQYGWVRKEEIERIQTPWGKE